MDPTTFQVVRSSFEHVTRLMSKNLQRTAYSPILYDMVDFSNALFDPATDLIGQTANVPVHIASMHFSVRSSIARFPEGLNEGDIVLLNDPFSGGTHLNDMTFTMPLYVGGQLLGYAASRGHWTDIGGAAPGGMVADATHVVQEGLRLPPVKLYEAGWLVEGIRDILQANTRVPYFIDGDLRAHVGALKTAERYMRELVARYGPETVLECMRLSLDYTERRTRQAIRCIPAGTYAAEDYIDCDGVTERSVRVAVRLEVAEDEITVDFTGTDAMVAGPINYPAAGTHSAVYWALKFFLDPEAPPNAGMYRPIHITIPAGTFINAEWPVPVFNGNLSSSERICDVIWQALAQAIPDRVVGMTYGDCNGLSVSGTMTPSRVPYVVADLPPGGWGGTPEHDGMDATYSRHGNCMDLTPEMLELLYPVRYEQRELITDSGGPGTSRGGLGVRETVVPVDHEAIVGLETSRTKEGPPGVNGGKPGRPGRSVRNLRRHDQEIWGGWDGDTWKMCTFARRPLSAGDAFTFEAAGGGGWGDPLARDPALVLEDVLDGYVSVEGAAQDYGVVIAGEGQDLTVDGVATAALRSSQATGGPRRRDQALGAAAIPDPSAGCGAQKRVSARSGLRTIRLHRPP